MCSKVDFADIVVAQHSGVSCVRGVVGGTVVDGAAGGESQACLKPVFFDELPGAVFQLLTASKREQHRGQRMTGTMGLFSGQILHPEEDETTKLLSCFLSSF